MIVMGGMDEKLKRAAEAYVKKEGESLLAEANEIRRQNVSYMTPRADRTVSGLVTKRKKPALRNTVFGLCAAAACIMIVARVVTGLPGPGGADSQAPGAAAEPPPPITAPGEILPISFTLPEGYAVGKAEFDNGMSVYSMESETHGGVVLTMYYEEDGLGGGAPGAPGAGFDEVIIDGMPVAAKVRDTYMLLTFERAGLSYTLSSEDNMGALAAFYRNIVEAVPA